MDLDPHWLRPEWFLALLVLVPLLLVVLRRARRASRWNDLVDPALRPFVLVGADGLLSMRALAFLALGWFLLVIALAGPAWQLASRPVFRIEQPRVLLLDLSESMRALDVSPTRLGRARFEVMDLLDGTEEGQFALIAFGAEPFLVSPLTTDAATVREQVPVLAPGILPLTGARRTDLALDFAAALLRRTGAAGADVVLVTDAIAPRQPALASAAALKSAGHRVSVLAVASGADFDDLARSGGGIAVSAQADDSDTSRLLALQGDRRVSEGADQVSIDRQWRDDGPWLLLLLLPLAALAFRRGWLGLWPMALLLGAPSQPLQASPWEALWLRPGQQAIRDAASGRLAAALETSSDPRWRAAFRYQAGDYAGALQELTGQAGVAAHYNRGNVLARLGRYEAAIAEYGAALALEPDHADAGHNRDLLRGLIRRPPGKTTLQSDQGQSDQGQSDQKQSDQDQTVGEAGEGGATDTPHAQGVEAETETAAGRAPRAPERGGAPEPPAGERADDSAALEPSRRAADPAADREPAPADDDRGEVEATGGREAVENEDPQSQPSAADAYLLRQVRDDPSRLMRERLLLQYLRRHGQLH
jgi:Ca-activated chloride channel family protein